MPQVIIPWRGGCEHRERALEFVCGKYAGMGWPVTVAEGGEPWVKADAVMPAVEAATASIIVVADADVWTDGLHEAVAAVRLGEGWARPHRLVHRLTAAASEDFMAGREWSGYDREPYIGMPGGGIVVARRTTLLDIPLDPRFVGWGQEDESWALALSALAGGPYRGQADLYHLWHPPQPRFSRRKGSVDNWNLMRRYLKVRLDPHGMRELVKEIHELRTSQSDLSDRDPDDHRL